MTDLQKRFNALHEKAPGTLILRGSNILVEAIEYEVKSKGGLIIANDSDYRHGTTEANKLQLGRVLMVGQGYYNEDGSESPCEIPRGAIVILPKTDTHIISTFAGLPVSGMKLHMVAERQILMYFKTEEEYNKYMEVMQNV